MAHLDSQAAQQRVSRRVLRYKRFMVHLIATMVVAIGISVAVDRFGASADLQDIVTPVVILVFLAHAMWIAYGETTNSIMQQEMRRELANLELDEKPKNDNRLAIGEDGELVEITEDQDYPVKQKYG